MSGSNHPVTVLYNDKENTRSTFLIYCYEGLPQKWREDKSINLMDVVQSFHVFLYREGVKGEPVTPNKGELE